MENKKQYIVKTREKKTNNMKEKKHNRNTIPSKLLNKTVTLYIQNVRK